ncbi:hypothetical protein Val02_43880 [Virgisporangium aliadipatigenens]|uniref:SIR2-like domain-containing protein n=1 Tax=Virgisporangium aliadipatigenens TaxID=741659 RepID=A0A8J4DSR5_9ACTN|nr:hypothetical protein [Virgisporangium aliadipatigenens]GIJ47502.1 hypothetical protein Val02_43880 [Virgisporangium aliadipatigenens]
MATERALIGRLVTASSRDRRIGLILGSGVTSSVVPDVSAMLDLADEFVSERADNSDLADALREVRRTARDAGEAYAGYRDVFTDWVSPQEFDLVVQQAALRAFEPALAKQPVGAPGRWERIGHHRGTELEQETAAWILPPGLTHLGELLVAAPARFGARVLTTNFDPLLEIAVRRAGGRAATVSIDDPPALELGVIDVVHLHGYWRPLDDLHDTAGPALRGDLTERLRGLLAGDVVCVLGYGGRPDALTAALDELARTGTDVLWAAHGPETLGPPPGIGPFTTYYDVDADRVLEALRTSLAPVTVPRQHAPVSLTRVPRQPVGDPVESHQARRPGLERLIRARRSADELLRQLDLDFGWRREGAAPGVAPELVYWPVQLRPANLIHLVQALAAASLSACGLHVVLCIDDLNPPPMETGALRDGLVADIVRWFDLVEGSTEPEVVSLEEFHGPAAVARRLQDPQRLLRPTHPWAVEREYYKVHTLFDVIRAVKAVPDVESSDAETEAVAITTGLTSTKAERLLTPLAVWAHLQDILVSRSADTVVTLGGDDEAHMWKLWHDVFPGRIRHLYNPRLENLRHDASMLRTGGFIEIRDRLKRALTLPTWAEDGHYVHWLVQNAVLLPAYLCDRPATGIGDGKLTWERARAALGDPRTRSRAISSVARQVSTLCLHDA